MANVETVYSSGGSNTTYLGIKFNIEFIKGYIISHVRDRFFDIQGTEELTHEFEDVIKTGFDKEILFDIFRLDEMPKYWRIGESLAECYLEDYKDIRFHYNNLRDAKNPKANLTGADLVGFVDIDNETVFLFGEVKTSSDTSSPPHVLYGRSGMIEQLEKIKSNPKIRDYLVRWLGFKVKDLSDDNPFKNDYRKALVMYIKSNKNRVKLIGVLVRDTRPIENDLKLRYEKLRKNLQEGMNIELIALYVSISIERLESLLSHKGENNGD